MTYTDKDVQTLVETAQWYEERLREAQAHKSTACGYDGTLLASALAPFLPDPEEQLIEKMAEVIRGPSDGVFFPDWENLEDSIKGQYRDSARAALEVVKREGLPT